MSVLPAQKQAESNLKRNVVMKKTKSIISVLLIFVLVFFGTACAKRNIQTESAATESVTVTDEIKQETVDETEPDAVSEKEVKTQAKTETELSESSLLITSEHTDAVTETLTERTTAHSIQHSRTYVPTTNNKNTETRSRSKDETSRKSKAQQSTSVKSDSGLVTEKSIGRVRVTVNCRHAVDYGIDNLPQDGLILDTETDLHRGDTALSVLKRACSENNVSIVENHGYISSISDLKEKDCGGSSGWMYVVNGELIMASSASCTVNDGDNVTFYYVTTYGDSL